MFVITVIKLCLHLQEWKEVSGTEQVGVIIHNVLSSEQV